MLPGAPGPIFFSEWMMEGAVFMPVVYEYDAEKYVGKIYKFRVCRRREMANAELCHTVFSLQSSVCLPGIQEIRFC